MSLYYYPSFPANCTSSTAPGGVCFDTGDTTWMILCSALVMLMTPGLAFFYGGLVRRRGVLNIMLQSFYSMGITGLVWYVMGHSLAFSGTGAFLGNMNEAFLINVHPWTPSAVNPNIPEFVYFVYELMFATITPALITGAFARRIRFGAYAIFLPLWLLLVYVPWAHWIWGGGYLAQWGVRDFAGGIVVHTTAAAASLATVIIVGKRKDTAPVAHNIPLAAIGTGLLWFGWYGFNAGSELAMNQIAGLAFINTTLAASMASLSFFYIDWVHRGKPSLIGILTGSVSGLVIITPCAGYVEIWAAVIIGFLGGGICWLSVWLIHSRLPGIDDALDVMGVHGIGGAIGSILLGCFGSTYINPTGGEGLFYRQGAFFGKQIAAVVFAAVYSFIFTSGLILLLKYTLPGGIRVTPEAEADLDRQTLKEHAYEAPEKHGHETEGSAPAL